MNRRSEPRFEISASVTLSPLDFPDREIKCELVDVSGAGMQLLADEPVPENEMVSLEIGAHLVLAGVRYCSPRGGKFTVGVERLHVVFAITLAEHQTKAARVRALIESYQLRSTQTANEALPEVRAEHLADVPQPPVFSPEAPPDGPREAALEITQTRRFARPRMLLVVVGAVLGALTLVFLMFALPAKPQGLTSLVPAQEPIPAVLDTPRKRRLSLKWSGPSWMSACVDGKKLIERALAAGDSREVEFSDSALLRVGSAGYVELALDGKSLGPLGRSGQVRLLEISSAGLRQLPTRAPAEDCAN